MSSLSTIISQINSLTGYNLPTGSQTYYISASGPLPSGSVNEIITQINGLTGFNIPATEVVFVSGSNIANQATLIYVPTPTSGTISTEGIRPGGIIKADQILNIINALNGISPNLIILSGSLQVTGSASFSSSMALPFIPDQEILYSSGGFTDGTDVLNGGSF